MPRYTLAHAYASNHNGRRFGPWQAGETIELDEADADWVGRDSPGALAPAEAPPKPERRGGRKGSS